MAEGCPRAPAIGIDLGTTNSCVAVYQNGQVQVLTNDHEKKVTASVVAFTPDGRLVGDVAKRYTFPEECVENIKRIMGRGAEDNHVREYEKHLCFPIIRSRGKVQVRVQERNGYLDLKPEEISAMILKHMKGVAERHLGQPVTDAVITVPAYFTDPQRRATLDAGRIAGLKVLQILNEPTAAALAYGFDNQDDDFHKLLVYDFGGGTFDVSVLTVEDGEFTVVSTDGDNYLGGVDIDTLMVKNLAREFQRTTGVDLNQDKKALRRLRAACEKAKKELSENLNATVDIPALKNDEDFNYSMTRAWLEDLCEDVLEKTRQIVTRTLADSRADKSSMTEVILVGGSTRMPMVTELMREIFNGKEPQGNINADEAVAYGAAIQAAILSGAKVRNIRLRQAVPMSLGIATKGGIMAPIIKRNSRIPAENTIRVTTNRDNQDCISVEIFEGERKLVKDNTVLGVLTLMNIPPTPRGIPKISVHFKVDRDGIVHASAYDPAGERTTSLTLSNRSNLSPTSLRRAIRRAEEMDQRDQREVRKIKAKERLENYMSKIRTTIRTPTLRDKINSEARDTLTKLLEEKEVMVRREQSDLSYVDYENSQNELEEMFKPIGISLYQEEGVHGYDALRPSSISDPFATSSPESTGDDGLEGQWTDLANEVVLDI